MQEYQAVCVCVCVVVCVGVCVCVQEYKAVGEKLQ